MSSCMLQCFGVVLALLQSEGTAAAQTHRAVQHLMEIDPEVHNPIVLAKVVESTVEEARATALLEVVHVYHGSDDLQGQQFSVVGARYFASHGALLFNEPPARGELGIWVLSTGEKAAAADPPVRGYVAVGFPARSTVRSSRFPEAQAWAQALETVEQASAEQRVKLLKVYARSSIWEVAEWATVVLGTSLGPSHQEAFDELQNEPDLTIATQIALDRVLTARRGEEWWKSLGRQEMLLRWVSELGGAYSESRVISRISEAVEFRHLGERDLLEIIERALENGRVSRSTKRAFVFLAGRLSLRSKEVGPEFEFLVKLLRSAPDPETRLAAAYALRNYVWLDAEKKMILEEARQDAENTEIAAVLAQAIEVDARPFPTEQTDAVRNMR